MASKAAFTSFLLLATASCSPAPAGKVKTSLKLQFPKAYDASIDIDNKPLGSYHNYPCHMLDRKDLNGMYIRDERAVLEAGKTHNAIINGKNSHSGGSCQFAISSDEYPHLRSEFKVITSIEGNCPGTTDSDLEPQPFYVPKDAAGGNYTFAWTWFPNSPGSGKPEMWMECAPVQIVAMKGNKAKKPKNAGKGWLKHLPTMFIANIDVKTYNADAEQKEYYKDQKDGKFGPKGRWNRGACVTKPHVDLAFPYQGKNVLNNVETSYKDQYKELNRKARSPEGDGCWNDERPVKDLPKDWGYKKRDLNNESGNESDEEFGDEPSEREEAELVARQIEPSFTPPPSTTTTSSSSVSTGPPSTPYTTTVLTTITQVGSTSTAGGASQYTTTRTISQVVVVTPSPSPQTAPYTTFSTTVITYVTSSTAPGGGITTYTTTETITEEQVVTPAPPPASSTPAPQPSAQPSIVPSGTPTTTASSASQTNGQSGISPSGTPTTTASSASQASGLPSIGPSDTPTTTASSASQTNGQPSTNPSLAPTTTTQAGPPISRTRTTTRSTFRSPGGPSRPGASTDTNTAGSSTSTDPPSGTGTSQAAGNSATQSITTTTSSIAPPPTQITPSGTDPTPTTQNPPSGTGTSQSATNSATPSPSVTSSTAQISSTALSTKVYSPLFLYGYPTPSIATVTVSSDLRYATLPTTFVISPGGNWSKAWVGPTLTMEYDGPNPIGLVVSDVSGGYYSATYATLVPRTITPTSTPAATTTDPTSNSAQPATNTSPSLVVSPPTQSVTTGTSTSQSNTSPSGGSTTTQNTPSSASGTSSQVSSSTASISSGTSSSQGSISSPAGSTTSQNAPSPTSGPSTQASSSTTSLITRYYYESFGAERQTRTITVDQVYSVTPSIFVLVPTDSIMPGTAQKTMTAEYDGITVQTVYLYGTVPTYSTLAKRSLKAAYSFVPRAPQAISPSANPSASQFTQDYTVLVETPRPTPTGSSPATSTPTGSAFTTFVTSSTVVIGHASTDSDAVHVSMSTSMTTYTTSTPVTGSPPTNSATSSSSPITETRGYFFPSGAGTANVINTITITYSRNTPPTKTIVITPVSSTPAATPASYARYTITAEYNMPTSQTILIGPATTTSGLVPTYTYVVEVPYRTTIVSSGTDVVTPSSASSGSTPSLAPTSSSPASSSTKPSLPPTSSSPASSSATPSSSPTSSSSASSSTTPSPSPTPPGTRYFAQGYFGDMGEEHLATANSRYLLTPSSWDLVPTTGPGDKYGIDAIITAAYDGLRTRTLLLYGENPGATTYTVLVETPRRTEASTTSSSSAAVTSSTPSSSPPSSTPSPASSSSTTPPVSTSGSPITLSIPTTTPTPSSSPSPSSSSPSPSSSSPVSVSSDSTSRITPCSSCTSSSTSADPSSPAVSTSDNTNMRTHTHTHTRTYHHTITHSHFPTSSPSTPPPDPSTQTPPPSPDSSSSPPPPSTLSTRRSRTRSRTRRPSSSPTPAPSPSPARRCTPENNGQLVCKADDKSVYALCDNGRVRWQPVAPGTQCVNNAIVAASDDNAEGNRLIGTASTPTPTPSATPSPSSSPPPPDSGPLTTNGNTIMTQPPPQPTQSTAGQSAPCQTDGKLYCNGEGLFGLCNFGVAQWQSVAPGTKCVDGEITYADSQPY